MGLGMIRRVWRYQGQSWAFRPLGHQGHRLRSSKVPSPHSGYMVAEVYKTLLLKSPRTPLDHRALADVGTSGLKR